MNICRRFGLQTADVNISLTAIQMLWDTGDYLSSNGEKIVRLAQSALDSNEHFELTSEKDMLIEDVWMLLFSHLAELCVDLRCTHEATLFVLPSFIHFVRPEVRKSGNETLFATLATHGEIFSVQKWSHC